MIPYPEKVIPPPSHHPCPSPAYISSTQLERRIGLSCRWRTIGSLRRAQQEPPLQMVMARGCNQRGYPCPVIRPAPLAHAPQCPRLTSASRGCERYVTQAFGHSPCSPFLAQENRRLTKELEHKDELIHFLRVQVGIDLLVCSSYPHAQSPIHLTYVRNSKSSEGHSNAQSVLRSSLPPTGTSWWGMHVCCPPTHWPQ